MAEGVLFNIAEEILKNLGNKALDEIASAWGFKARLEKLRNTITTIKNVLLDAEERQSESHAVRGWLERLQAAVYTTDDLFDEFATVASQKELLDGNKLNKLTKEVRVFFSHHNQIALAFAISQKIKRVREDLDAIVKDGNEFSFVVCPYEERRLACRPQRDETHSYVDSKEVVGRDDDKKAIIDTLLGSTSQEHALSVVSIVGFGGLGKTTLAQMIYNDNEVEKHFDLRLWVCVSDTFDIKEIVKKIITSATNAETQRLEMDQLQSQLRKQVGGKKYLLVLDDVWNEDREQWLKLKALLKAGKEGSKILVTTRSREVANIMGPVPPHDLQLLSHDDSWALFEKMAFEPGEAQKKPTLTKLGREIVQKCGNIPLAIRTLASLLYGKHEDKWLAVKDRSLAQLSDNGNVMTILKLSYDHLLPPLKNCFAYCALFPKDYELQKETLINLWMAEGFLLPADECQSLEEVGEEYFLTLLHRCFFQDITKDKWGNIKGCKMHDLMHDLAKQVAGAEMKVANYGETSLEKRTHHLSFGYPLTSTREIPRCVLDLKLLRTLLLPEQRYDGSDFSRSISHKIVSNFRCLRVLDLHQLGIETLPSSIGKLIHLRYLDLSRTPIKALPDSITKLQNLQTLNLDECNWLRRLPTDIRKLVNLRTLAVSPYLAYMPSGIGELTLLHKLTNLNVNSRKPPALWWKHATAKLSDLRNLNNLRGALQVNIGGELKDPVFEAREANLSRKHGLIELHIKMFLYIKMFDDSDRGVEHDEAVLEGLKPHPNLKKLEISGCRGQKLPSWAVMGNLCTSLPNLVEIRLYWCIKCQQLPAFSQLPFLKCLCLEVLESVEYMESSLWLLSESPEETLFFPSLQELQLSDMGNLKGWWKEVETVNKDDQKEPSVPMPPKQQHPSGKSFSSLLNLKIERCPNLTSMPLCPNVEILSLVIVNESLPLLKMAASLSSEELSVATTSSSPTCGSSPKLKILSIDRVEDLISLPEDCLRHLSTLEIQDPKFQSTSRLGEVLRSLSSLRSLKFSNCYSLRSFCGGLEHLTALENLVIDSCDRLDLLSNEEVENGMPWKAFNSLRSLKLRMLPTVVALPSGLQHLTNLRSLEMDFMLELMALPAWISCFKSLEYMELCVCPKLTSLPEGFRELDSLNELRIVKCLGLTERCRGPSGEDWPKIRHIPLVIVRQNYLE